MSSNSNQNEQYVDSHGPQEDAVKAGFQWLRRLGNEDTNKRKALLATPVKDNLDGVVESVIGPGPVKKLKKNNSVKAGEVDIHHITERIDAPAWDGGPVLVILSKQESPG